MHIKKLELLNFNGIESFNSEFTGGIYFITGENEVGKSTLLNAIGTLLDGKRGEVLKNGEEKGFAKMVIGDDLKEYEVDLKFTKANPRGTLSIKSDDGMKSDNVSMLQKVFGYTDFDAVEFSRWSETAEGRRKQIAVVKSLLSEDVQKRIDQIDIDVEEKKNLRKDVNSEVKMYTAVVKNAQVGLKQEDIKQFSKKIEIDELMQKQSENAQLIEKAKTVRASLAQRIQQLQGIPQRKIKIATDFEYFEKDLLAKIAEAKEKAEKEIKSIEAERLDYQTKKLNAEIWLSNYEAADPEKTNVAQQLKEAQEHNEKHAKVLEYVKKKKELITSEEKAKAYDDEISVLLTERENIIATSSLPIEGLSFTDEGLELNGVPFVPGKVSDSQIMEIAMKFTVAVNKNANVFMVARGESLGGARLKEIIDFAKKEGFQGFIENVVRGQQELRVEEYTENTLDNTHDGF